MILAVDGNNIAFSCNCVSRLCRTDGFPTQAIVGFFKTMHALVEEYQPGKVFVAFDGGRSKRRLSIYPKYKAGRYESLTPQQELTIKEFRQQIPLIQDHVPLIGAAVLRGDGVEADDLIAMIAAQCEKLGAPCVIVSTDKDFFQLLSPTVSISRGAEKKVTHESLVKSHGLRPEQWLDFRCIVGDDSDNIGGVHGAGEKTALSVLQRFGTLERFFAAPGKVNSREAKILASGSIIARNRKIMGLRNFEGSFPKVNIIPPKPDLTALKRFFIEYQFNSVLLDINRWFSAFHCLDCMPPF
jgi:DNA polymerase-1